MTEKRTILVVEDESMLLGLLKAILEDEGYRVETAEDGAEAVEVFRRCQKEIGVVLSDMGLPKLGGWEVFQKLKEIRPDVKVILASGFVDDSVRNDMIKQGASDVIQKPYVPNSILERIKELMDSK